jgi:UrcA family protein
MLKPAMIATLALGAAAVSLPAIAQPIAPGVPGVEVRGRVVGGDLQILHKRIDISDIDANTPDGARRLFWRVSDAADEVCSPSLFAVRNIADLNETRDFQRCKSESIHLALSDVHSAAMADLLHDYQ